MIIERRRYARKSYQNYPGIPVKPGVLEQFSPEKKTEKSNAFRKITYFPVDLISSPTEWDDDSVLSTVTTPRLLLYGYAILTALTFFGIAYSIFAG